MIDLTTLRPVLKGEKIQAPTKKAANLPGFAQILGASISRDIGTPPAPLQVAPAPVAKPIAIPKSTPAPSVGKPLPATHNTQKVPVSALPAASRDNPVTFKDLRSAIDSALHEQRQREQAQSFERGRSAFSRIAPTKKSDVQGGGSGNAWGLRNIGGKLASTVLNGTARKDDTKPVGSSALDIAFGRGR